MASPNDSDRGAWAGREPLLHVVLHEPEIPNNTGNIGRSCVALASALHLIEPLGFDIDEKACRRAGLDYWPRLRLSTHASWEGYRAAAPGARRWMLTTRTERSALDAPILPGDHLVFGKESSGLPGEILDTDPASCIRLPMVPGERSLNLSTAVASVMFLAIRGFVARGLVRDEGGRLSPGPDDDATAAKPRTAAPGTPASDRT